MSRRVAGFGTTVFVEINKLARQHGAVNLGQGAPDFDGPPEVLQAAITAVNSALNQYAPGTGMPIVREAIAKHAERFYGQTLDPETEVLVTSGATEGMFAAILGLTDPGDEVIVFEPVYDTYVPNMVMAGVTPRYVALRGDDWTFDPDELAKAFNSRTRAIIVNTPHNPDRQSLLARRIGGIAALCQKHDVDSDHRRSLRAYPLRWRGAHATGNVAGNGRTDSDDQHAWVKLSASPVGKSAGRSVPSLLVTAVNRAHQFITYAVASPLQAAAATALGDAVDISSRISRAFIRANETACSMLLQKAGFEVLKPQGSYFIMADWRGVAPSRVQDDLQFAAVAHDRSRCSLHSSEHLLPGLRQTSRQVPRAFCRVQKRRDPRSRRRKIDGDWKSRETRSPACKRIFAEPR